jgi:hypothetical protein
MIKTPMISRKMDIANECLSKGESRREKFALDHHPSLVRVDGKKALFIFLMPTRSGYGSATVLRSANELFTSKAEVVTESSEGRVLHVLVRDTVYLGWKHKRLSMNISETAGTTKSS